jgi:hypothetical protein
MKVSYIEGLANHIDPESCIGVRKVAGEALTGAGGRAGWGLSCEIDAPSRGGLLRDAGVLVSQEHTSEGEAFLLQSLQLARERGLLSLELRAGISLYRLQRFGLVRWVVGETAGRGADRRRRGVDLLLQGE